MVDSVAFTIGQRIEDKKTEDRGTVEYVGNVEGSKGLWIGVNWDDVNRGRHNGCHGGIQYFNARSETSGSFMRVGRVSPGVDLETAVREKYQAAPPDTAPLESMLQHAFNARFVQIVGMEMVSKKLRNLEKLYIIELKNCQVSSPGSTDLNGLLPRVRELSLCGNLLNSWDTVGEIVKQLPTLKSLNLSDNKLQMPDDLTVHSSTFNHIQQLIINRMHGYRWEELVAVTSMFKNVNSLRMAYNDLNILSPIPEGTLECVESLDIGANPIDDWQQLLHLSGMKRLQELNLTNCQLKFIEFPTESPDEEPNQPTKYFAALNCLYLNYNPLDKWRSVCQLAKLQSLEQLILGFEVKADDYFPEFTYAIIRSLKVLNRTHVSRSEKRDYDLFYLKSFSKEYYLSGGTEDPALAELTQEFKQKHPTYLTIVKESGAPYDDSKEISHSQRRLKDLKLTINLCAVDGNTIQLSLLPSIKVSRLKMTVKRTLKLPSSAKIQLSYVPANRCLDISIPLDSDHRELSYYSIGQGDTLHVKC